MARPKVGDLIPIGAIGSAKKGDVLEGKTYSSDEGVDLEGAMPNNGSISNTITTQGGQIAIPKGYTSGGSVKAQFANLIASNIKEGINVGGVVGTLEEKKFVTGVVEGYKTQDDDSYKIDVPLPKNFNLYFAVLRKDLYTIIYFNSPKEAYLYHINHSGSDLSSLYFLDELTLWETKQALLGEWEYYAWGE